MTNGEMSFVTQNRFDYLPARKGPRPKTLRGPLHIQYTGHGDLRFLKQLIANVLSWPHIEPTAPLISHPTTIAVRLDEQATAGDPSAFITAREFARVLLGAATIYLTLPLVCAHWAIVRGWAEPHYLSSFGLMPAGAVVLYTPRDQSELEISHLLFSESYHVARKLVCVDREGAISGCQICSELALKRPLPDCK